MLVIKPSHLLVLLCRCRRANDDDDGDDVDGLDKQQQRDDEVDFFAALALCWHASCETVVATEGKVADDIVVLWYFKIVILSLSLSFSRLLCARSSVFDESEVRCSFSKIFTF